MATQSQANAMSLSLFHKELKDTVKNDKKFIILHMRMRGCLIQKEEEFYVPADVVAVIRDKAAYMKQPHYQIEKDDEELYRNFLKLIECVKLF